MSHGILGKGLLLEDEDPAEYEALFQSLVDDLRPVGTLELIHVERIATAVWRQRRLIRAETAAVAFRRSLTDTRKMLTDSLGAGESARFKDPDLKPLDDDEWLKVGSLNAMMAEILGLQPLPTTLASLEQVAPVFKSYLSQQAAAKGQSIYRYLELRAHLPEEQMSEILAKVIAEEQKRMPKEFAGYENRIQVTMVREHHQAMKVIPPEAELFARYQVSLDNTLTKAIKALREAQVLRLSVVDQQAERES